MSNTKRKVATPKAIYHYDAQGKRRWPPYVNVHLDPPAYRILQRQARKQGVALEKAAAGLVADGVTRVPDKLRRAPKRGEGTQAHVWMPPALKRQVKTIAAQRGVTPTVVVYNLIRGSGKP